MEGLILNIGKLITFVNIIGFVHYFVMEFFPIIMSGI